MISVRVALEPIDPFDEQRPGLRVVIGGAARPMLICLGEAARAL